MPQTLANFSDSEIRMRFKEPFLTEGLNAKLAVNQAPGIYRGFRLISHIAASTVTVIPGDLGNDHVAVFQTAAGRSLSLRKEGGSFSLDLSAYVNKTVVLAIFASYTLGDDTAAEIRAYELSPSDEYSGAGELPELVVLGTVVVPGAGVIPDANITHTRRTMAWEKQAQEAVTWASLIRNGGFENSTTGATHARAARFWALSATSGTWSPVVTDANTGLKSLQFSYGGAPSTALAAQPVNVPVTAGQLVRVQLFVRAQQVLTAGTMMLDLTWLDGTGAVVATSQVSIPATGVDASYRKIETTLPVPAAPAGILTLAQVVLNLAGVTFGVASTAVRFDDIQVWVESKSVTGQFLQHEVARSYEVIQDLLFEEQGLSADAIALRFANATGLIGERKDQSTSAAVQPVLDWKGRLALGANLQDTEAKALTSRVTAAVNTALGVDFTLMWVSQGSGLAGFRLYADSTTGAMLYTVNASFDGTNWIKDINGQEAFKLELRKELFGIFHQISGTNTWLDNAWLASETQANGVLNMFLGTAAAQYIFAPAQLQMKLGTGSDQFTFTPTAMTHAADLLPSADALYSAGSSSVQFLKMWSRNLAIGPAPTADHAVVLKGAFDYPTQTEQVEFESVSRVWGIWQRTGHRFVEDFDKNTTLPPGWVVTTTGGGNGNAVLAPSTLPHRIRVTHDGANSGTYTLRTVDTIRWRLTAGFICRIRFKHYMGADFTRPRIGFWDLTGGLGNGITFCPTVIDGGGSHAYGFRVGNADTTNIGANDHAFSTAQRWMTFAVIGSKLFWSRDELTPDGLVSPSDSYATSGSATITVPTGLYNFIIRADGGSMGYGTTVNNEIDYVEIISGSRE